MPRFNFSSFGFGSAAGSAAGSADSAGGQAFDAMAAMQALLAMPLHIVFASSRPMLLASLQHTEQMLQGTLQVCESVAHSLANDIPASSPRDQTIKTVLKSGLWHADSRVQELCPQLIARVAVLRARLAALPADDSLSAEAVQDFLAAVHQLDKDAEPINAWRRELLAEVATQLRSLN